tara:strand:+ start:9402 stop:9761 length:360 start_codon:yes stop_codon:yes gene_type:complete
VVYLKASVLDTFFHITGDVYAITQHAFAPLLVVALNYMSYETYKTNKHLGILSFGLAFFGLGLAFIDGAPGITPNYDVFKHPSILDPNYVLGHVGAHLAATMVPLLYIKTTIMKNGRKY